MNFPCPKCNTPDKGVLLFNLVAPCDACSGIKKKVKSKYTIQNHKELTTIGKFLQVALACGPDTPGDRSYTQTQIDRGCNDYIWTIYAFFSKHKDFIEYPDDICIVQWSE